MRASLWGLLALTLLSACGDDFDPRTLLNTYRVIGVEAERPEVGPDDVVRVLVHDFNPDEGPVERRWTLCLYSLGSVTDYTCIDDQLEFELEGDAEVMVDLSENGIGLRSLYETYGPFYDTSGDELTLEEGFDVYLFLKSGPVGGPSTRTIKRLRVSENEDPNNTNPGIARFSADDQTEAPIEVAAGSRIDLAVELTPDAVQTYVNAEEDTVDEEMLFTWYTTAGETDPGLTIDDDRDTRLKVPDEAGPLTVFVAARDNRGGLSVSRLDLVITPASR